jgi:cytochrome c oxidase subunit 4
MNAMAPGPRDAEARLRRRCAFAWLALLGLLGFTVGMASLHLGAANLAISMAVAAAKAALVAWVFMALSEASALLRVTAAIGLAALALLGGLSAVDFGPRRDEPLPWQSPQQRAPLLAEPPPVASAMPAVPPSARSK